jgi:hypothetical protein
VKKVLAALAVALVLAPAGAAPKQRGSVVRVEHRDPTSAPTRGPTTALVTIELFIDPTTAMQQRRPIYRALERLQANHPARIRLIYRIVKRTQQQVSIAALEAQAQGRFDEFMSELHLERSTAMLTKDKVLELVKRAGVDPTRVSAAIADGRYSDVLEYNDNRLERLARAPSVPNALFNAKVPRISLGAPADPDLEREYQAAYQRAEELVDRGVPVHRLMAAFEQQALRSDQPFVSSSDDDSFETETEHKLAKPPLELRGLPSFGKPTANAKAGDAAIPVVVLCRPNDSGCFNMMRVVTKLQKVYGSGVRIVWAPWFDVANDNAADLSRLGDAMLCAEKLGSSPEEPAASPGWRWISKQLEHINRAHGRRGDIEKLIDNVAGELDIDTPPLSACRAQLAGATLDWVGRARRAGVTRSPALVIGGRIYEGLNDQTLIQQLIEAELAPGVLARCATIGCSSE